MEQVEKRNLVPELVNADARKLVEKNTDLTYGGNPY